MARHRHDTARRGVGLGSLLPLAASLTAGSCGSPGAISPTPEEANPEPVTQEEAAPEQEAAPGSQVTLERLIDGDSMELVIDGEVVQIRVEGINAPELRTLAEADSCNGQEAERAMEALLAGGELVFQPTGTDRFGRVLGALSAGGIDVAAAMVGQGWALGLWSAEDPLLVDSMQEAAAAGRGLWGETCGRPAAQLEIAGHQVDPPGRDEENLNQEWVELVNPSEGPVDLNGWSVADETTSNRFALPALELAPGQTLRILTGTGPRTGTEVHLDQDQPVWSNRGETILVVDPAGRIAAQRFLSS